MFNKCGAYLKHRYLSSHIKRLFHQVQSTRNRENQQAANPSLAARMCIISNYLNTKELVLPLHFKNIICPILKIKLWTDTPQINNKEFKYFIYIYFFI